MSAELVAALARSLRAQVVETHISWVLLAGERAYKVKKPVRLPFVDYSTLDARHRFCEEEVRLNRRLAPGLYVGVSRVTGSTDAPTIDGPGPAVEFAVCMRRFDQAALFSARVRAGTLGAADVDALAALLGGFHAAAPRDTVSFASPERRRAVAMAALEGTRGEFGEREHALLHAWLDAEASRLAPLWRDRVEAGCVRECHGDLHLDNIVALPSGIAAFDCIEFDAALRWIDVVDDIAFPVMDLAAHGRRDLAFRLLDGWLDFTGDHAALPALRFSAVSRALVRAQVARLRGDATAARRYLDAAVAWTRPATCRLVITHGLPGSGKSFQSQRLLEREGAIRIRSDVERKRLFGLAPLEDSRAKGLDLYTAEVTARTYAALFARAKTALLSGYPVVLDAAFLKRAERDAAAALAREIGVPFGILACEAPPALLKQRLAARARDVSEADAAVLDKLLPAAEPLTCEERALTLAPMAA